ncbi:MAG: NAD(P)-binding domain-containing protein [Tannerellaceae bacterium]|nr:NAD(P)-binding domain-containing protein [Tannerellaceae bacterium]
MKTAILGAGNIGTAIAQGLLKGTLTVPEDIVCTTKSPASLERLRQQLPPSVSLTHDNASAVRQSRLVFLAVKPALIASIIKEIRLSLTAEHILVSVAAGVTFEQLSGFLGKDAPAVSLFRLMPNTALSVSQSMTLISAAEPSAHSDLLLRLFAETGRSILIPEQLMAAGTLLTSAGIAFALRYIRAATEGGVALGFRPADAQSLVAQTVLGAVALLSANETHPEVEIDKVTSPGGVTIRGLNAMEEAGFTKAVLAGLRLPTTI